MGVDVSVLKIPTRFGGLVAPCHRVGLLEGGVTHRAGFSSMRSNRPSGDLGDKSLLPGNGCWTAGGIPILRIFSVFSLARATFSVSVSLIPN
jgi:hypothetical protein